jgi:uncharacterized coiled-coil protein SlyX
MDDDHIQILNYIGGQDVATNKISEIGNITKEQDERINALQDIIVEQHKKIERLHQYITALSKTYTILINDNFEVKY